MNLIKELGGYKTLKREYEETLPLIQKGYKSKSMEVIRLILLEYRRQHNIFEVGDKVVVKSKPIFSDDYKIHIIKDEYLDDPCMGAVRHATDKEIAQGFRDEL